MELGNAKYLLLYLYRKHRGKHDTRGFDGLFLTRSWQKDRRPDRAMTCLLQSRGKSRLEGVDGGDSHNRRSLRGSRTLMAEFIVNIIFLLLFFNRVLQALWQLCARLAQVSSRLMLASAEDAYRTS